MSRYPCPVHGITEICKALIKIGIKNFAVATVEEALKIKEINDEVTILILGPVENEYMSKILDRNIYFMIIDFEEIEYIEKKGINIDVFLKIDTGMGKVGFQEDEIPELIEKLKNCKYMNATRVFSHFSSSDRKAHV